MRNPFLSPEFISRKPSFNDMGAMRLNKYNRLNQDLAAWCLANEGAGNILFDIQNGNRVALGSSAAWSGGDFYGAGTLYGILDTPRNVSGTFPTTMAINVRLNSFADYQYLMQCTAWGGSAASLFSMSTLITTGQLYYWENSGNRMGPTLSLNTDYTIVFVFRSATVVLCYLNGIGQTIAQPTNAFTGLGGPALHISGLDGDSGYGIRGKMRWAAVWNREITAPESIQLHLNPYGTPDNPRFIVEPQRIWFVPSGVTPPVTAIPLMMTMGMGQ